ncbi:22083_t:CDS:1, partial [Dentiscutata erythropus]
HEESFSELNENPEIVDDEIIEEECAVKSLKDAVETHKNKEH